MGGRVWRWDTKLSRETEFLRRSVRDGFKWAGTILLCRQAYQQQDIDEGKVDHCPVCWDPVLKQVSNTRCKECYGTGYANGGYKPMFVTMGSIMENSPLDEKYENAGNRIEQNMTLKLPCDPIFRNGDVFVEVRRSLDGEPTELGRIVKLDGPVKRQTVQGWVSNNTNDRETRIEDMIISQEGTCRLLLPTDPTYLWSEDFWTLHADPYVDGERSECPRDAAYDEYAREIDCRHIKLNWRP